MNNPHDPTKPSEPAYGVPRIGPGPGGKAVRLADLARELMERYGMARQDAVLSHLLPPLEAAEPPALYFLRPGGNAEAVGAIEWFATGDGNPIGERKLSNGIGRGYRTTPAASSCGHGVAGAVKWLRGVWGNAANTDADCFDSVAVLAYRLAVSEADAAAVWGWGSGAGAVVVAAPLELADVETWEQLVAWRLEKTKGGRGPDWGLGAGKQLRILGAELQQRMGKEIGRASCRETV